MSVVGWSCLAGLSAFLLLAVHIYGAGAAGLIVLSVLATAVALADVENHL